MRALVVGAALLLSACEGGKGAAAVGPAGGSPPEDDTGVTVPLDGSDDGTDGTDGTDGGTDGTDSTDDGTDGGTGDGTGDGTDGGTGDGTDGGTDGTDGTGGPTADWGALDPCTVTPPAETVVYTETTTVEDDAAWGLVCQNATVSFLGDRARVVVGTRGSAVLSGAGALAWLGDRGDVVVVGAGAGVGTSNASGVNDRSGDADVVTCDTLTVDLSALSEGC